jgi:hypothetical protein
MVTRVETGGSVQPGGGVTVYVTVYVFWLLVLGRIEPVDALSESPEGVAVNVPPVVPVRLTGCQVLTVLQ